MSGKSFIIQKEVLKVANWNLSTTAFTRFATEILRAFAGRLASGAHLASFISPGGP